MQWNRLNVISDNIVNWFKTLNDQIVEVHINARR